MIELAYDIASGADYKFNTAFVGAQVFDWSHSFHRFLRYTCRDGALFGDCFDSFER